MGVATVADAQTASPAPGTVTVRLNGRMRFYGYYAVDRDVDNNAAGSATGTVNAAGQGTLSGQNKAANYGFGEYARLYPGFDGVAANGLKYGSSLEIRQDQVSGAGGGAFGSISQTSRSRAGLYFRRVWGYLGSNQLGTIRLGAVDSASSLYMTGNFENFNDGGLNGDVPGLLNQNTYVTWPFADVGNLYTTNKVVYLSPQIFGFDAGVSFEPSTAALSNGNNCGSGSPVGANFINANGAFTAAAGAAGQGVTGPGCDRLSSSPSNAESQRRRNNFDGLLRYRGSFGGVGIAATAGYIGGGHVLDNQTGVAFNSNPLVGATGIGTATPLNGTVRNDYEGLSVGDFGLAATFGGLSVGGKYQFGRFNGSFALLPRGLPDGEAVLVGTSYTFGPIIVGAHGLLYKSAGDISSAANGRKRVEHGLAAGATYSLAPGVSLFLSYVYNERKQNGYNFVTNQGTTAAAPRGNAFNNKVSSNLIALGTAFSW